MSVFVWSARQWSFKIVFSISKQWNVYLVHWAFPNYNFFFAVEWLFHPADRSRFASHLTRRVQCPVASTRSKVACRTWYSASKRTFQELESPSSRTEIIATRKPHTSQSTSTSALMLRLCVNGWKMLDPPAEGILTSVMNLFCTRYRAFPGHVGHRGRWWWSGTRTRTSRVTRIIPSI